MYAESVCKLRNDLRATHLWARISKSKSELQELNVELKDFNQYEEFLDSNRFFFEPMPLEKLQTTHAINHRILGKEEYGSLELDEFGPNKIPTTNQESIGMNPHKRATMLYQYFENQLFHLPRQSIINGRGSLGHDAMWDLIT